MRDLAVERANQPILMNALAGMADCHRRHGDYEQAISNARTAIAIPEGPDFPANGPARSRASSERVALALKLARWHGELGRLDEAEEWLEVVQADVEHGDRQLYASWLDGYAVARLDRGDMAGAKENALEAAERAFLQHDEVVLLQARTTLSMVHVKTGEYLEALRQAEAALHYRKRRRSLIVLALAALAARRTGDLSRAGALFRDLLGETETRIARDDHDFAAWDLNGYAVCGLYLDGAADIGGAMAAFRKSRDITAPPANLLARLRFLLRELDPGGSAESLVLGER